MIYVVLVLAGLLLLAIVVIVAMVGGIEVQKKKVATLETLLDVAAKDKALTEGANQQESAAKEAVITHLKTEIAELEKLLAENRDPAVVRARLGKLLSDP